MRLLLNKICLVLWFLISLFEKAFWFIKRNVQLQRFRHCGENVFIGRYCFFTGETILINNDVYIGEGCRFQSVSSKILIGSHVMFGPNVSIHGGDHRKDLLGKYIKEIRQSDKIPINDQDVLIEDDVWVGANAIILKGVTIGEGSIIGAGSVVTRNVPPYSILVGTKSQKIFSRWTEDEIIRHKTIINLRKIQKNI